MPIPAILQDVIDHLVQWQLLPVHKKPNGCIINFFNEVHSLINRINTGFQYFRTDLAEYNALCSSPNSLVFEMLDSISNG